MERNRYNVPAAYANQAISLHVYPDRLEIIADAGIIATHQRLFNRHYDSGKTVYNWQHYVSVLQRKPGSLRNGTPFLEMPDNFRQLKRQLLKYKGGDRQMADILTLILHYPENELELAIIKALKSEHPSKEHVINCLNRLQKKGTSLPVNTPSQLILVTEPKANTQRYDKLRGLH